MMGFGMGGRSWSEVGLLEMHWDWDYFGYDQSRLFLLKLFVIRTLGY